MRVFSVLLLLASLVASTPAQAERVDPARERLGIRMGYIGSSGSLKQAFGDGRYQTLHFSERIKAPVWLQFKIGTINMGNLFDRQIQEDIKKRLPATFTLDQLSSEMQFSFFNVGPEVLFPVGESWWGHAGIGMGVYSVAIYFDDGIQAFDISDQHFGISGAAGLLIPFIGNFAWDITVAGHQIFTGADETNYYNIYTGGGTDPHVLQISVGGTLSLR